MTTAVDTSAPDDAEVEREHYAVAGQDHRDLVTRPKRATAEAARANRLAAKLREPGVDPDLV